MVQGARREDPFAFAKSMQAGAQAIQRQSAQAQQDLAADQWKFQKYAYSQQTEAARGAASGLSSMIGQYNQAYGEAKTANEQRYQRMLGITDQTSGQRASDIRRDFSGQQSDMMQRLASLGMSNTTIAPTLGQGIERNKQAALDRSADSLQGTKLGIMERRTDKYPQSNVIMALVQALGSAGVGGAGGDIMKALSGMRTG